jgi:hypothetical protein
MERKMKFYSFFKKTARFSKALYIANHLEGDVDMYS